MTTVFNDARFFLEDSLKLIVRGRERFTSCREGAQQAFDFRLRVKLRPYERARYFAETATEAWVFSQAMLRVQPEPA
jgi:hypothetical protein